MEKMSAHSALDLREMMAAVSQSSSKSPIVIASFLEQSAIVLLKAALKGYA